MSRSDIDRLRDIVESIRAIAQAEATARHHAGEADVERVTLDAVQYRVMTIGEATKGLSSDLREQHPEVPWSDMARMRDLIGHHYYRLDPEIVRATIAEPVARLRTACEAILAGLLESSPDGEQ